MINNNYVLINTIVQRQKKSTTYIEYIPPFLSLYSQENVTINISTIEIFGFIFFTLDTFGQ